MNDLTILERLNNSLSEAEEKIRKLEDQISQKDYSDSWGWRHIFQISEEDNLDLPVPRLELRYRVDKYNAYADYGLVQKHLLGHIDFIPISSTRVSLNYASVLELPMRDGAHIRHDCVNLRLPAYVVYNKSYKRIDSQE